MFCNDCGDTATHRVPTEDKYLCGDCLEMYPTDLPSYELNQKEPV